MLQRHEIDAIFDAHQDAPTMSYRYYVTEAIELALEKKRAALATPAWQPIETAPYKQEIIAWHESLGKVLVTYLRDGTQGDGAYTSWDGTYFEDGFTHWMPLPPAPEPAK